MVMSDRIAVMHDGRIEQIDTPTTVYKYPRNRFVADFLGEANLFDVTVGESDGTRATVVYANGARGEVHVSGARAAGSGASGRGTVCVRPERIRFVADGERTENAVDALCVSHLHLGASVRCIARVFDQDVIVTRPDQSGFVPPEPGARVRLGWGMADGQLLADEGARNIG
jgi:ABC-type Fe3+/spermidine/putrescine transport system ATPase subunit